MEQMLADNISGITQALRVNVFQGLREGLKDAFITAGASGCRPLPHVTSAPTEQ